MTLVEALLGSASSPIGGSITALKKRADLARKQLQKISVSDDELANCTQMFGHGMIVHWPMSAMSHALPSVWPYNSDKASARDRNRWSNRPSLTHKECRSAHLTGRQRKRGVIWRGH